MTPALSGEGRGEVEKKKREEEDDEARRALSTSRLLLVRRDAPFSPPDKRLRRATLFQSRIETRLSSSRFFSPALSPRLCARACVCVSLFLVSTQ